MGTHRSKHNKGRKPLYKEHGNESVKYFDFGAEPKRQHEKIVPVVRNTKPRPPAEIALAESVARYLAGRPRETKLDFADQPFPMADVAERQYYNTDHLQTNDGGILVAPSERDILMQMYVEKKISPLQLRAGRSWQWDMEAAAIQPNVSIDWSAPRRGLHYQARGDLTERQYQAMLRRRDFQQAMGVAAMRMLDYCLDVDRGRADLIFRLQCVSKNIDRLMRDLLDTIAAASGIEITGRRQWVWKANDVHDAGAPRFTGFGVVNSDARRANTTMARRGSRPVVIERSRRLGMTGLPNFTKAASMPTRSL